MTITPTPGAHAPAHATRSGVAPAPTSVAKAATPTRRTASDADTKDTAAADSQARRGAGQLGGAAAAAGTDASDSTRGTNSSKSAEREKAPSPQGGPTTTERLEAAREHVPDAAALAGKPVDEQDRIRSEYEAEQSAMYDLVARELEAQGRPDREDFRLPSGKYLDWEYREALAYYDSQLEEAQQGAKPERMRRLRAELAQTASGREMLEFERLAGVPITIKTDAEWRADGEDPNVLAYSAGDQGLTFNVRHLNAHVYVHEMTHQVDHRTHVLAPDGDGRTRDEVVAEATRLYEQYGLDPTEVPALVDATYGQPAQGATLSHAHTRLAEARQHRLELGGDPLSADEMAEVLALSRPREQDTAAVNAWNDSHDDQALLAHASSTGIETDGMGAEQVVELLRQRGEAREAQIVEIERRGTRAAGGGIAGELGSLGKAVAQAGAKAANGGG